MKWDSLELVRNKKGGRKDIGLMPKFELEWFDNIATANIVLNDWDFYMNTMLFTYMRDCVLELS